MVTCIMFHHAMHFWFSFLCLCVVARQCLAAASLTDGDGVTVIPCTNSVGYYSVLSNNRYVLNCSGSTVAGSEKLPFMNLYPTMMLETEARGISRTSFFENVTILVTGGGMLPSLQFRDEVVNYATDRNIITTTAPIVVIIRNISVFVSNVQVHAEYLFENSSSKSPDIFASMFVLSMAARNVSQFIVENIHVQLEESDVALNMTNLPKGVSDNDIVIAASLSIYHGGQSAPTKWNGLHVLVSNCNINITLLSSQNVQAFGMITLIPQNRSSIAGVDVTISNGTCMHFSVDVSQLFSARTFIEIKPSFLAIYCPPDSKELYECEATNVTIFIGDRHHAQHPTAATVSSRRNINLFLEEAIPGSQGAIEMVALISIRDASVIQNINISIPGGSDGVGSETTTYLTARCMCKGNSCSRLLTNVSFNTTIDVSARVFYIQGTTQDLPLLRRTYFTNFSFTAAGAGALVVVLDAAKTAFLGSFSYFLVVKDVNVTLSMTEGSQVLVTSRGADIGSSSRNIGVFEISNVDSATEVTILTTTTIVSVEASSGGCAIAAATVVGFLGNISYSTVTLTNVSLLAIMDNGTTLVLPVSLLGLFSIGAMLLTMVTNLVSINAQDPHYMDVGRGIRVVVTNSSVRAMHTSNFPSAFIDSSTGIPIVASSMSAITSGRSLENCEIALSNVEVQRLFPVNAGASSWFPTKILQNGGVTVNTTALIMVMSTNATTTVATSFYVDLAQTLFLGGGGSQVACVNLSVTIMDNCTVSYEERLAALAAPKTDLLSFLAFGCIILNSSFVVVGAHLIATSGAAEAATNFGSLITTVGVTTLSHCTVNFRDVRTAGTGIGKLLVAKYRTLSLTDNTLMIFDDVQLNAQTYSFAAEGGHHHYGVEVVNTSTFPSVGIEVAPFQETVPPSAAPNSFIRCNATICVSQSSFKGFTSLVMPNSFTILSASATRGGAEGFLLQLGCNVWNGTGMSLTDVVPPTTPATTLLRFVTFPASRYNDTITCNDPDTRPTADPQMHTVFPTAITTVIAIAGLVSGLSGGTLDAPVLVAMGVSSCAPSSLRESTSSAQFLISPFYPFGDFAMVLGNLAVFVVLHLLHRVGVWWYRRQQLPNTMNSLFSQHEDHVSKSSSTRVSLRPEVALKFPNHSLLVAMLAAPGVVHGGVHGLFSGEVIGTVAGVAAIGIVAGGGYWRVRAGRSRVASKMMFLLYRNSIRKAFVAPWLLPLGQWGPPALRATHGRLRGTVRAGSEWLSAHVFCVSVAVVAMTSIPVPASWCVGLWSAMCLVDVAAAILVIVVRPSRAPVSDILQFCGLSLAAGLQICAGLSSRIDESAVQTALAQSVLQLASMGVAFLKTAHSFFVVMWERAENGTTVLSDVLITTAATTTSERIGNRRRGVRGRHRLLHIDDTRENVSACSPQMLSRTPVVSEKHSRRGLVALDVHKALALLVDAACESTTMLLKLDDLVQ